jgi:hypothetical protein
MLFLLGVYLYSYLLKPLKINICGLKIGGELTSSTLLLAVTPETTK